MITEVVELQIKDGEAAAFEHAISQAEEVLSRATGWQGLSLMRCIEDPQRYQALICWDTADNHMVDFREGPLFADWRALVGQFFTKPPEVLHYDTVASLPAP